MTSSEDIGFLFVHIEEGDCGRCAARDLHFAKQNEGVLGRRSRPRTVMCGCAAHNARAAHFSTCSKLSIGRRICTKD